jgi:hypothetical protein
LSGFVVVYYFMRDQDLSTGSRCAAALRSQSQKWASRSRHLSATLAILHLWLLARNKLATPDNYANLNVKMEIS